MKLARILVSTLTLVAAVAAGPRDAAAGEPNAMFLVRTSAKSPDAVVAAIRNYVTARDWAYVNDASLKGVVFVKFCVPELARDIFAAGDHVAALLPCGSIAVYRKGGGSELSMLHPAYMNALYPDANLKRAGEKGLPMFTELLDAVTR